MTTEQTKTRITKSGFAAYLQQGIDYTTYKQRMTVDLATNEDPKIKEYINLNAHRMHRVEKTYQVGEVLAMQVTSLKDKTYWLVINEHWCGDGAQSLPVFEKLAEISEGKIDLKLVYRDENPELMDAYLTNGSRSIPKLVQLDVHYNVTGIWGPRPYEAQKLVKRLKSDPETAPNYGNELHLWYAKDKQQSLEAELQQLLLSAEMFCTDCIA